MKRIVYVCRSSPAHYKQIDEAILRQAYTVTIHHYKYTLGSLIRYWSLLGNADLAYFWFGSVWAVFGVLAARLRQVKVVVVAGGYDVANCPELNYGHGRSWWGRLVARIVFGNADQVMPVSHFAEKELLEIVKPKSVTVIYNAVDLPPRWPSVRKPAVITIGNIDDFTAQRKGYVAFIELARKFPDLSFVHIGKVVDQATALALESAAPANLRYLNFVEREALTDWMLSSLIYLQLSKHEAFGVTVAEAMACGMEVIVSDAGALPEVVGASGWIIRDVEEAAVIIQRLLKGDDRKSGMERQAAQFDLALRRKALLALIDGLMMKGGKSED